MLAGWIIISPMISKQDNTEAQKSFSVVDGGAVQIFGAWHVWYVLILILLKIKKKNIYLFIYLKLDF